MKRLDERRAPKWDSFSWLTVRALYDSVNDVIAKRSRSVVNRRRARWISAQRAAGYAAARTDTAAGAPFKPGFVVDRSAHAPHLLIVGDTGEADASQYVVIDPLLAVHRSDLGPTDFMVILSDVIYPAGDINDYVNGFFIPYRDYDKPIHALPGNHDWYDGLNGFMYHFCSAEPLPRVSFRATSYRPGEIIARMLWRGADEPDRKLLSAYRHRRAIRHGLPAAVQPAPYHAIDTKHVRIVAIDTGISGEIDAEQARWLLEVSNSEQPKILLTGKPIYVDNEYRAGKIEWDPKDEHAATETRAAMTVDDIVRNPDHHYVAALGGDVHNYQRYPVKVGDRTIQYIVSGGGGAYLSGTHRIPLVGSEPNKPEHAPPDGPLSEDEFRCYPLRGDCLAYFARRSGPRLFMAFLWALALLAAGSFLFLETVPLDGDRRETIAAGFGLVLLVGVSVGLAGWLKKHVPDAVAYFLSALLAGGGIAVAVARLVELDRGELWAAAGVALGAPLVLILATVISYEARRSVPPFLPPALVAAPMVAGILLLVGAPDFGDPTRFERALIWGLGGVGLVLLTASLRWLRDRVHSGRLKLRDRGRKNRGKLAAALALWDVFVVFAPWAVLAACALADSHTWVRESILVLAGALAAIGLVPLLVPAAQQRDPRADSLVTGVAHLGRAAKAGAALAIFGLVAAAAAQTGDDWVVEAFLDGVAVTVAVLAFAFYLLFADELRSIVGWIWVTVLVAGVLTLTIGMEPLVLLAGVAVLVVLLVLLALGKLSRAGGFRTMLALWEGDINADEAAALVANRLRPGEKPTRGEPAGTISDKARRIADVIYPTRLGHESVVAKFVAELSDTNEPPFFKNFLRIDVEEKSDDGDAMLNIRCYGVTGFEGKTEVPSVEDSVSIELKRI